MSDSMLPDQAAMYEQIDKSRQQLVDAVARIPSDDPRTPPERLADTVLRSAERFLSAACGTLALLQVEEEAETNPKPFVARILMRMDNTENAAIEGLAELSLLSVSLRMMLTEREDE